MPQTKSTRWLGIAALVGVSLLVLFGGVVVATGAIDPAATTPIGRAANQTREQFCDIVQPNRPVRYTFSWFSCDKLVPPSANTVSEIGNNSTSGQRLLPFAENKLSLWRAGVVLSADRESYATVLVWTERNECELTRMVLQRRGLNLRPETSWHCPNDLGELMITDVTGAEGVISFTSTSGTSGSFDMATGQWQFAVDE